MSRYGHFPDFKYKYGHDISNLVFYFKTCDPYLDKNGDGYFTIKVDDIPDSASDDVDANLASYAAYIQTKHPTLDLNTFAVSRLRAAK